VRVTVTSGDPQRSGTQGLDDVDRTFARLNQLPAPRDFALGVMQAVVAARPVKISAAWLLASGVCLVLTLILGFLTGQALVGGGLFVVVEAISANWELLISDPGDILLTLVDVVPWLELLGTVTALSALSVALRRLQERAAGVGVAATVSGDA
jgi:hypothetical protein